MCFLASGFALILLATHPSILHPKSTREQKHLSLLRIWRWLLELIVGCRNCDLRAAVTRQMDIPRSGHAMTGGDNSQQLADNEHVKPGPSGLQHRPTSDYEQSTASVCSSESSDLPSTWRRAMKRGEIETESRLASSPTRLSV